METQLVYFNNSQNLNMLLQPNQPTPADYLILKHKENTSVAPSEYHQWPSEPSVF